MLYKDWLTESLDYYVQPRTKKRTYEKYQKQINKHVLPILGGVRYGRFNGGFFAKIRRRAH